jgi:hypothetical protein
VQGSYFDVAAFAAACVDNTSVLFISFPPTRVDFPIDRAKRAVEERLQVSARRSLGLSPGSGADLPEAPFSFRMTEARVPSALPRV